ncbi:hypothetical protein GEMRC1_006672 [Eukaryota sp. GEM-RC1]
MYSLFTQLSKFAEPIVTNLLLCGPRSSGKTIFLEYLKRFDSKPSSIPTTTPSYGLNIVHFTNRLFPRNPFRFWELPGDDSFSDLWGDYARKSHALLYFIPVNPSPSCLSIFHSVSGLVHGCPIAFVVTSPVEIDQDEFLAISQLVLACVSESQLRSATVHKFVTTSGQGMDEIIQYFVQKLIYTKTLRRIEED